MWRTAKLSSSLFETVVWIYVLNEKSQIPYGSYHAELAKWRAKLLFFSGSCIDFIKHYYSWHSCKKIEIEAVWIFIFKKDMNEPNDLYNFVP